MGHPPASHQFPQLGTASTCSAQIFGGQHCRHKNNGLNTIEVYLGLNPCHEGTNAKPWWEYSPAKPEPGSKSTGGNE